MHGGKIWVESEIGKGGKPQSHSQSLPSEESVVRSKGRSRREEKFRIAKSEIRNNSNDPKNYKFETSGIGFEVLDFPDFDFFGFRFVSDFDIRISDLVGCDVFAGTYSGIRKEFSRKME